MAVCFHDRTDCPYCIEPPEPKRSYCVACARELEGRERTHCNACRRRGFKAGKLTLRAVSEAPIPRTKASGD